MVAQPHGFGLLAVLADRGMQQREHIAHAGFGHDPRDQLHRPATAENTCATAVADWFCSALASTPWLCGHAGAHLAHGVEICSAG